MAAKKDSEEKWWTTAQAARRWRVSVPRVVQLLEEGRVPGARRHPTRRQWQIPQGAPKPKRRKAGRPQGAKDRIAWRGAPSP